MEAFFGQVSLAIDSLLNPQRSIVVEEPIDVGVKGKPVADAKKVDPKAKQAPPAKGKAPVKG